MRLLDGLRHQLTGSAHLLSRSPLLPTAFDWSWPGRDWSVSGSRGRRSPKCWWSWCQRSAGAIDPHRPTVAEPVASAYAGAERQVIGVLTVPNWQSGMGPEILPRVYQDIVEVVAEAPGPVRAKRIVPRIGLQVETGKIEATRAKLKRLVERGLAGRGCPGACSLWPPSGRCFAQLPSTVGHFRAYIRRRDPNDAGREEP